MDPNQYLNKHRPIKETDPKNTKNAIPNSFNDTAPVRKRPVRKENNTGKLYVSGKRFFGQILIDHWVIRINGEQKELPFGQNKLSLELPAGMYLVTAYTPYLGMHCMRATADVEIRPGRVTHISYQTVFDIFKNGIMKHSFHSVK
ncbi:MAG: hypothetical protein K2H01_10415 [Ruminococcus sp.]|nr:hypothetical protein [Ruminococcus sp.]